MGGEGESAAVLPFHCGRLNADYLRSPCEKNLGRIKALKKMGFSWLGPLEHCVECRGRDLVKRPEEGEKMAGVVEFKDMEEAERVLGPGKVRQALPPDEPEDETEKKVNKCEPRGKFCRAHPEVEAVKTKNGRYMGMCRQCMRDRAARNSRNRGGRMQETPALPAPPPMRTLSPVKIKEARAAVSRLVKSSRRAPDSGDWTPSMKDSTPLCEKHQLPLQKSRSGGEVLPGCPQCYREWNAPARGRFKSRYDSLLEMEKELAVLKKSIPEGAIVLDLTNHPKIREWIKSSQEEGLRPDLSTEVIYWLIQAMRGAC